MNRRDESASTLGIDVQASGEPSISAEHYFCGPQRLARDSPARGGMTFFPMDRLAVEWSRQGLATVRLSNRDPQSNAG